MKLAAAALLLAGVVCSCASGSTGSADAAAAFRFVRVAGGFTSPVYVTTPKTEPTNLYVVQQTGQIRVLVKGKRRAASFLDISDQISRGGEQGPLSMAFDPDYAKNRRIYIDYTDRAGDTHIVRYTTNRVRALPSTRKEILFVDQPYENHNGGLVLFGPDNRLYVGMGDGGAGGDPQNRAQNMDTKLGKLLSIDQNNLDAGWKIAAYGLRNPWRYSWDRSTHDLWIGDVGQNAFEEVDYVPASGTGDLLNFGWPTYEGNSKYKDAPLTPGGRLVGPVQVYSHDSGRCSVTGGYVYRGSAVPAAKGRYFFGDYCTGDVWTLRSAAGRVGSLVHLTRKIPNLSSFGETPRGELYATGLDGSIYRLSK